MSFDEDLATMRVRRVPRALRGAKGKRVKNMAGTGHSDEDIQHHLTNAMNGRSTDETRGHVFKALNAINKRQRADRSAAPSVQADATSTGIHAAGMRAKKTTDAFFEAAKEGSDQGYPLTDTEMQSRPGGAKGVRARVAGATKAREDAEKDYRRTRGPGLRGGDPFGPFIREKEGSLTTAVRELPSLTRKKK